MRFASKSPLAASAHGPGVPGGSTSRSPGSARAFSTSRYWATRRPSARGQDQAAGGDARPRGDDDVLDAGDLVHGAAAHLAHRLGDPVHAVDVGLAELAAVRVDRER